MAAASVRVRSRKSMTSSNNADDVEQQVLSVNCETLSSRICYKALASEAFMSAFARRRLPTPPPALGPKADNALTFQLEPFPRADEDRGQGLAKLKRTPLVL
jgi:hypothetical protein